MWLQAAGEVDEQLGEGEADFGQVLKKPEKKSTGNALWVAPWQPCCCAMSVFANSAYSVGSTCISHRIKLVVLLLPAHLPATAATCVGASTASASAI